MARFSVGVQSHSCYFSEKIIVNSFVNLIGSWEHTFFFLNQPVYLLEQWMFWLCGEGQFTYGTSRKSLLEQIISEIDLQFQNLIEVEIYICSSVSNGIFILFISLVHQKEENTNFNIGMIYIFLINKKI